MPALAVIPDLEVRLGSDLSGKDLARAQSNLDDVSILVRVEGSKEWTLDTVPEEARLVTIQAALRAFRNPDGFSGENIGGAYSYTYGPGAQNGVYLNADEVRLCRVAAGLSEDGRPKGYVGSVRTPSAYAAGTVPVLRVNDAPVGVALTDPVDILDAQVNLLQGDELMP